jgi:type IV secretory pathway VirB4 component
MPESADNQEKEQVLLYREPTEDEFLLGFAHDNEILDRTVFVLKGMPQKDRDKHCYIIGAHGTGKTKLMEYFIRQDIKRGFGFGVIDPHGDLIEEVKGYLALYGGDDLDERVVLVDPTDEERCICFNPLERTAETKTNIAGQARRLVSAFKKIWPDNWGPRLDEIFRNTLIALIEHGQTLAEVHLMLTNDAVREKLTRNLKNEACQEFFSKFEDWSKWRKEDYSGSTLNKVSTFLTDERIRRIFSASKSTIDFRKIMDDGKILLVKLSKGDMEDDGLLVGSLLLATMQSAAMGRGDTDEEDRRPFYLYIDEFQNFATKSFVGIIDETRKYKLSLTLANQNLGQVPDEFKRSLMGCGLQAYFRLTRSDADYLAKEAYAGIFVDPPPWETFIQRIQSWGEGQFTAKSHAMGGTVELNVDRIRSAYQLSGMESRKEFKELVKRADIGGRYLRTREDVDKEYRARRQALIAGEKETDDFYDKAR